MKKVWVYSLALSTVSGIITDAIDAGLSNRLMSLYHVGMLGTCPIMPNFNCADCTLRAGALQYKLSLQGWGLEYFNCADLHLAKNSYDDVRKGYGRLTGGRLQFCRQCLQN
jgi:hypothetical protein